VARASDCARVSDEAPDQVSPALEGPEVVVRVCREPVEMDRAEWEPSDTDWVRRADQARAADQALETVAAMLHWIWVELDWGPAAARALEMAPDRALAMTVWERVKVAHPDPVETARLPPVGLETDVELAVGAWHWREPAPVWAMGKVRRQSTAQAEALADSVREARASAAKQRLGRRSTARLSTARVAQVASAPVERARAPAIGRTGGLRPALFFVSLWVLRNIQPIGTRRPPRSSILPRRSGNVAAFPTRRLK